MVKEETLSLVKELASLESLSDRSADLAFLKRERKRLDKAEGESYADQEKIDEFNKYYDILASKVSLLSISSYDEKKALVEKAKEVLNEKNFKKAGEMMDEIFANFKQAGRCTKEQDDELWAEMKATRDAYFANRKAHFDEMKTKMADAKAKKEAIIEEAKAVLEIQNFRDANNKMTELMNRWKEAGFAPKADNEALWATFSEIRKEFFAKRKEYAENMKTVYEERVAAKQEIIKKARIALANSTFTKEEINSVKELRNEWKAAGFAGKENDDKLWNEFQGIVNKYFEELRSVNN